MSADRPVVIWHAAVAMCCVWLVGPPSVGCAWLGGRTQPEWVEGTSVTYAPAQYLVGVGQADDRSTATDRAYAAVARIFRAEVATQAKDWESYLVVENHGGSSTVRRLTLDIVTKVTTDKVLENVRIADTWYDPKANLHYALAVMNRAQAETALMERLAMLDQAVESDVAESRQTANKLAKVRGLRRAAKNLVLREAYNADLRVIRPSGHGIPAAHRVGELTAELDRFLTTNLVVAVRVDGDHAEPVRRALTEGLIREGLHVVTEPADESGAPPELLVRGLVRIMPIEVLDPQFKYVRWCSDVEVMETAGGRVVGAATRGGKEGHLTEREATARALRVIQQEFSTEVATAIAGHIYGETPLPPPGSMPGGCPRSNASSQPM